MMMFPVLRTMDRSLDHFFRGFFNNDWVNETRWIAPSMNVKENNTEYELELAAPGMTREDFEVSVNHDGNLVVKLEHKDKQEEENKAAHYLRRDFSYSSYRKVLSLPDDVDKDGIEAKVEDGVLHVRMPRTAEAQRQQRRIEVN